MLSFRLSVDATLVVAMLVAVSVIACGTGSARRDLDASRARLRDALTDDFQGRNNMFIQMYQQGKISKEELLDQLAFGHAGAAEMAAAVAAIQKKTDDAINRPLPQDAPAPVKAWSSPPAQPLPTGQALVTPQRIDLCSIMSCPPPPSQGKTYIPVSPSDPANAGLNSSGYPTR